MPYKNFVLPALPAISLLLGRFLLICYTFKMNAITVTNLVKKYGKVTAINGTSFTVEAGSFFALLGTNGAGKSTTISCLTTILPPSSGEIRVNGRLIGQDNDEIRREIGVVFQKSLLDDLLTVRENLDSRAQFYDIADPAKAIQDLAKLLELKDFLDQRYGTLSGGQKRRADIARALIHKPKILFLDEPTAGLDPESRHSVWKTIKNLQETSNLTVFLTTHYMQETEQAHQVCIMHKGTIIARGTPQSLRAQFSHDQLRLVPKDMAHMEAILLKRSLTAVRVADSLLVDTNDSQQAMELLHDYQANITDFEYVHGNMDDVFLNLTNSSEMNKVAS